MFIARTTPIWSTRQVHVTYNKLLASGQKERMKLLITVAAAARHASYAVIRLFNAHKD